MRLLLLPISTKRTLLYCIRSDPALPQEPGLLGKVTKKAAKLWAGWEKKESGWQRKVVDYGNHAFRRIPYQEWGLKSVPPLSARRREREISGTDKVEVVFPGSLIPASKAEQVLQTLGTEREGLHKTRLIWCMVGMPITIPFALIPVIPNLPFFYLLYRAWSHWTAIRGGKHIQFLLKHKLLTFSPSPLFDKIYASARPQYEAPTSNLPPSSEPEAEKEATTTKTGSEPPEELLITKDIGWQLSEALDHPEIALETERALWQVERDVLAESKAKKES